MKPPTKYEAILTSCSLVPGHSWADACISMGLDRSPSINTEVMDARDIDSCAWHGYAALGELKFHKQIFEQYQLNYLLDQRVIPIDTVKESGEF